VSKAISNKENTVYVVAPTGRDAELICSILQRANIEVEVCHNVENLGNTITAGAGAVLIAEEALNEMVTASLIGALGLQPVWSDLPVVIFSSSVRNAEAILQTFSDRINATVVERPIRITMLLSTVRGVLRARQRQYQTRDLLEQLELSDKQKDLFLATLSHELRTPLNSIIGWLQILKTKPREHRKLDHALDVIERNAKTQSEIISDILFVSRIVTGKLELKRQHVDVVEIVRDAVDIMRPLLDAKKISLEMRVEPGLTTVNGDPERLQQVFLNLLSNSGKFTKRCGSVSVSVQQAEDSVEVAILDSGRGIARDFLPFVFDRFRQADSTFTRRVGGLGLGLAIVRHLIDLHGGEVSAESEGRNRGATFTVRLPIARDTGPATTSVNGFKPRAPGKNGLTGLRVLLVEDDQDSQEMLSMYLQTHGVEIAAVETANDALNEVLRFKPEVVISDVGLPERDGYDLIHDLRDLPIEQGGGVPAIALTGYASPQDRDRALAAGFQEHLSKPIDVEELVRVIRELITDRSRHGDDGPTPSIQKAT
jgi:signal transduction histidine kinase/CheY-like chemotaxis protein